MWKNFWLFASSQSMVKASMYRGRACWIEWNVIVFCALLALPSSAAQNLPSPSGTLILTGGEFGSGVIPRFVELAGGRDASLVYVPSGSSGIKVPGVTWVPPELPDATNNTPQFEEGLSALFGVRSVRVLHSRNRSDWDSESFAAVLRAADGVWIGPGNAGRLASFMLRTRAQRELAGLLRRGKVIGGNSAGAIIAGSFIVRGAPGKPVLIARDNSRGFGFVPNVAINPHLTEAKREDELVQVIELHPHLLGVGIDEKAAIVVTGDRMEVIGEDRVAIYDGQEHEGRWYYYLSPGSVFDLRARMVR